MTGFSFTLDGIIGLQYALTCWGDREALITALYHVLSSAFSTAHNTPGLISLKGVLSLLCNKDRRNDIHMVPIGDLFKSSNGAC